MPAAAADDAPSAAQRREIEADCRRVLLSAFRELDEFAYAQLVARFTEDGTWHREGRELAGRAQILAGLEQRPRRQLVRHLVTNLLVGVESRSRAVASGYNTVFRALDASAADAPVALTAPLGLWVLDATLVRSGDDWLISGLRQTQQFSFG